MLAAEEKLILEDVIMYGESANCFIINQTHLNCVNCMQIFNHGSDECLVMNLYSRAVEKYKELYGEEELFVLLLTRECDE